MWFSATITEIIRRKIGGFSDHDETLCANMGRSGLGRGGMDGAGDRGMRLTERPEPRTGQGCGGAMRSMVSGKNKSVLNSKLPLSCLPC